MELPLVSVESAAGLLLTAPFGLTLLFIIYIAIRQQRSMFHPSPEDLAANVNTSRFGSIMGIVGMTAGLLGFTLLMLLMQEPQGNLISILALVLFGLATLLWILDMSLNMSVRIWAAQYLVEKGVEPEFWPAFRQWSRVTIPTVYLFLGYLATAGFGLAILQTAILPAWLGWVSIIWSGAWLVIVTLGWGIPAFAVVMPFVIGLALLIQG